MIPSALYFLSSHSLKQWGQLGEILGGVRFPESGASRWLVQPPKPGEVVSNTGSAYDFMQKSKFQKWREPLQHQGLAEFLHSFWSGSLLR